MIGKNKIILRDVKFLLLPIIFFGFFSFYWKQRNTASRLAVQSTSFNVLRTDVDGLHPMSSFVFWITYTGQKPEWWGKESSWGLIKDFKLVDRNGQIVQAVPFKTKGVIVGKLREVPSGFSSSKEAYRAFVSMAVPPNRPINGGTISATLQIVDSYKSPKKVYAQTKIKITADIYCDYEGC